MGQSARLEEDLLINPIKSSTMLAPRVSLSYCFPHWNLSSNGVSLFLGFAPSCNLTLTPTPISSPSPALVATNDLLKQFMKTYLETSQGLKQPPLKQEQFFKAKVPEMYYGKLHMDCYYIC